MSHKNNVEHIFIGSYWSGRRESLHECVNRIVPYLIKINSLLKFDHWYLKAHSKKRAMVPIEITIESIENLVRDQNGEIDAQGYSDMGFFFSAWNGKNEDSWSVSILCGGYSEMVKNYVVLYMPPMEVPFTPAMNRLIKDLHDVSIAAWSPDNAVVTSDESMSRSGVGVPWKATCMVQYRK